MDKIEKLELKAKLAEDSGNHQKAYNIRKKIKELQAKVKYKQAKKISKLSKDNKKDKEDEKPSLINKIKKLVKTTGKKVEEDIPKINKDKNPPVVKKDEKPPVVNSDNPEGKPLSSIDKKPKVITTTSSTQKIGGTYGLAYGKDGKKGVGSVTIGDKIYKPGDDGFEEASKQFLQSIQNRETVDEKIKNIKKRRRNNGE